MNRLYPGINECSKCGANFTIVVYDDNYPNRDNTPISCPVCHVYLGDIRTSGYVHVEK